MLKEIMQRKKSFKAFTLIELLIVIAVIGILVAVILPNLIGMRERARDTVRKNDLAQLGKALRLYFNEFGFYPFDLSEKICCDASPVYNACVTACGTNFEVGATSYMKAIPSTEYKYDQLDGGDDFLLSIPLENASDQDLEKSALRCNQTPSNLYYICAD
jgi:prepilin-type N-terminal cleavage/methylation domain-containing protein